MLTIIAPARLWWETRGSMPELFRDQEYLLKLARTRMPFGKYEGTLLVNLPEPYVVWFAREGFPDGELGRMLAIVHEVKVNGLEYLFKPLLPPQDSRDSTRG